MKNTKQKRTTMYLLLFLAISSTIFFVSGCSKDSTPGKSPVEKVDDLANAKIGVQLGTTGDIYVSDEYKDAVVQQFNKGADAIQSLKQGKLSV